MLVIPTSAAKRFALAASRLATDTILTVADGSTPFTKERAMFAVLRIPTRSGGSGAGREGGVAGDGVDGVMRSLPDGAFGLQCCIF